jgi:hypothetical protein
MLDLLVFVQFGLHSAATGGAFVWRSVPVLWKGKRRRCYGPALLSDKFAKACKIVGLFLAQSAITIGVRLRKACPFSGTKYSNQRL